MKDLFLRDKGQSLVEMALILPILMLILLGIIEFGRILGGYVELQSAARDVTRYAAIHQEVTTSGELVPLVNTRLTLLDPSNVTVVFARTESVDKKDVWVQVTLNYPLELMTPFFGAIVSDPLNLTSRMVMRVE